MDITTLIETISKLSALITVILSAIFFEPLKYFISNSRDRKTRRLNNVKEYKTLTDELDVEFRNGFVVNDFKERYFYLQTGIITNEQSIYQYLELKKKLKKNFTWKSIKKALPYLKFENDEIVVKISGFLKKMAQIILIGALFIIFVGLAVPIYFSNDLRLFELKEILELVCLTTISIFSGIYLLYLISPLCMAIAIEKALSEHQSKKNESRKPKYLDSNNP
ncbi:MULTISPECIES: hypothetical protein [Sphingobacterium]|uniref:hypothetical protein n=1 Tax=Sphingobacterium TaxID=28453 RepID=UPI00257E3584|nr:MULTISPECIES: hypothetical protein [Sphingobacterium]